MKKLQLHFRKALCLCLFCKASLLVRMEVFFYFITIKNCFI